MTRDAGDGGAKSAPPPFSDEEFSWVQEHLTQLQESVSGQRLVLWSLLIGFVLGLAAYVGGYALKASATTEPWKLGGDLLYALGWALWTGVVLALFVEAIPKVKQRQIKQALDAYEAALREKTQAGRTQTSAQISRGDA